MTLILEKSKSHEILHEDNIIVEIKKKKGRPRKNPIPEVKPNETEKKKRGRKKKDKIEEEPKIKKKRGRKAALKYFSSTIRKKMPLTASIQDNDKSILHLNIKEEDTNIKKQITYDVLKSEYINSIPKINTEGKIIWDIENKKDIIEDIIKDKNNTLHTDICNPEIKNDDDDNDILYDYIEQSNENQLDVEELYEKRLQIRLKQDNNLIEKLENLHKDDNLISKLLNNMEKKIESSKIIKIKNDDKQNGYCKVLKEFIENDHWLDNTDICCWWCCHNFKTVPIGIPVEYNIKINKFRVKGIFCSFACLLAYKKNDYKNESFKTTSLISFMYKKLTGMLPNTSNKHTIDLLKISPRLNEIFDDNDDYDTKIKKDYINSIISFIETPLKEASPRSTLKMFGGELSIEEFRSSVKEHRIYKMIEYPLCISRDYIEEIDLEKIKNVNISFFKNKNTSGNNIYNSHNTNNNNNTEKQIEEAKERISNNTDNFIVTNNSIDRFIKFN